MQVKPSPAEVADQNRTLTDKLRHSTFENRDNLNSTSPKLDRWSKAKDEYSYTANMFPTDPSKRFLIDGADDCRIIKDLVKSTEKPTYYPKKVDEVWLFLPRLSRNCGLTRRPARLPREGSSEMPSS